jgi:hypothetical protein
MAIRLDCVGHLPLPSREPAQVRESLPLRPLALSFREEVAELGIGLNDADQFRNLRLLSAR